MERLENYLPNKAREIPGAIILDRDKLIVGATPYMVNINNGVHAALLLPRAPGHPEEFWEFFPEHSQATQVH